MHEKFPPQHQVQLDKLLNLDTSYSWTYWTRMSEAVRITTIQAGVIAQYNRSEREEISAFKAKSRSYLFTYSISKC